MAFDTNRRRALLFGGSDPGPAALFGDTWTWGGENWTQVEDIGPQPRSDAALAYDPPRDRTVLFGGRHGISQLADTWEWNGEDWTQVGAIGVVGLGSLHCQPRMDVGQPSANALQDPNRLRRHVHA